MGARAFVLPLLALVLASCASRPASTVAQTSATAAPREPVVFEAEPQAEGVQITLSEGAASAPSAVDSARAATTPLTDAQIQALLSRVPELDSADAEPFKLRPGSKPPPLSGSDVLAPWPPPPGELPPTVADAPLELLRWAPEGEVPLVPQLSVSFNQPMVSVTSQQAAAAVQPVELSPQPSGAWRWVGTRTLLFDADARFPMATTYTASVPAGTQSATGMGLDEAVSWSFTTPPPSLISRWPQHGPQGLSPVIFLGFDQRVDAKAVLDHLSVRAKGRAVPVRLATMADWAGDAQLLPLIERSTEGRWLAVVPASPLPKHATVLVELAQGAFSAEGPNPTAKPQNFSFETYGPFKMTRHVCAWRSQPCRPDMAWNIEFSNPIDPGSFDPKAWQIDPEIEQALIAPSGQWVSIHGRKPGRTTYTVRVPQIRDRFGQTLDNPGPVQFKVAKALPSLVGPGPMVVLDPTGPRALSVYSTNHSKLRVQIRRVTAKDWHALHRWYRDQRSRNREAGPLPGELLSDTWVPVNHAADQRVETAIDLSAYLTDGLGQLLLLVTPPASTNKRQRPHRVLSWVQATSIGLTALSDSDELLGWATDLGNGAPLADVTLSIFPDGPSTKTGADGVGVVPLQRRQSELSQVLVAQAGDDVAYLPASSHLWGAAIPWVKRSRPSTGRWLVFDDRGLYRPGETAHIKGWLRSYEAFKGGQLRGASPAITGIDYLLRDVHGNELAKGKTDLGELGGFDFAIDLPPTTNLGAAQLELVATAHGDRVDSHHMTLRIEEFRRPEFEVQARVDEGPHLLGQSSSLSVGASYFAGGGLGNAPVRWTVYATPGSFTPPGHDGYIFGQWFPWWRGRGYQAEQRIGQHEGSTDPTGTHHLDLHVDAMRPARPMTLRAEATVTDVNRQAWTATTQLLVHPSELYVGLRIDKPFVPKGEPFVVLGVVVDHDGRPSPGATAEVELVRDSWVWSDGSYARSEADRQACTLRSADEPGSCSFTPAKGGSHTLRATVTDSQGRPNTTERTIWVPGGEPRPSRTLAKEELTLVPSAQHPQPGDTVQILVSSPFADGEGLLTLRRSGLVEHHRFHMTGSTHLLDVPIVDAHIPTLTVAVDVVGKAPRSRGEGDSAQALADRPAFASGLIRFDVRPLTRALAVQVTPHSAELSPGADTSIDITVHDATGDPVFGAELAVLVVDESVLSLTGYALADPLAVFYASRDAGVSEFHSRALVELADPDALEAPPEDVQAEAAELDSAIGALSMPRAPAGRSAPAANGDSDKMRKFESTASDAGPSAAIALRNNLDALALFAPAVRTDARGQVTVPLTLPDNLTRYRVMVVAVAGERLFGKGESAITARLPIMLRPSPPRFLNYGDRFELPLVVQNQTDRPQRVQIAARANNLLLSDAGVLVEVPANDRVEVRLHAESLSAGTATVQAIAHSPAGSDASSFTLPVYTPATTEAFATYGSLTQGAVSQPIAPPADVVHAFGGLELTTSSTQLHALTDAFIYLTTYPYDCNEQRASRLMSVAGLRDVLAAFASEQLPSPAELNEQVLSDLEALSVRQNGDGGWGFWRRGDKSWPYLTVHIAHALVRAKAKGYPVDEAMLKRAKRYLEQIDRHLPRWYSQESRWAIEAYALYTLHHDGSSHGGRATALLNKAGSALPLEAQGWLLPVLHGAGNTQAITTILRNLDNRVTETAGQAHFATSYSDGAHVLLHSDRRVDGVLLDSLLQVRPQHDVVPKLVSGLLAQRTRGRWASTQENAFVLQAMDRYFHAYEGVEPDLVARAWLGDGFLGEHRFKGRTTERVHTGVPMAELQRQGAEVPFILSNEGAGRLYYRVGLRYAPASLALDPADHGFAVERTYEAVDEPSDVRRDADGTWFIRAGAQVRVRLTMVAPSRRYHVALVDPLPAGLEPINPTLAVSGTPPADPSDSVDPYWFWRSTWYQHQNLRDDRVEAFTTLLWAGVHRYDYLARATTPGSFVVPPAKAEEMYAPETFGRSGTARVIVE